MIPIKGNYNGFKLIGTIKYLGNRIEILKITIKINTMNMICALGYTMFFLVMSM